MSLYTGNIPTSSRRTYIRLNPNAHLARREPRAAVLERVLAIPEKSVSFQREHNLSTSKSWQRDACRRGQRTLRALIDLVTRCWCAVLELYIHQITHGSCTTETRLKDRGQFPKASYRTSTAMPLFATSHGLVVWG